MTPTLLPPLSALLLRMRRSLSPQRQVLPPVILPARSYILTHELGGEHHFRCSPDQVGLSLCGVHGMSDVCRDALSHRALHGRLPARVGAFWTLSYLEAP